MKKIILTVLLCVSLNAVGQTVLKDRKQNLRVERVIQNNVTIYKLYCNESYLLIGSKTEKDLFLQELLNVIKNQKTANTYIGNTAVKYEPFENGVQVYAKTFSFRLSQKQIIKIKEK
jgi:hypothetical protein